MFAARVRPLGALGEGGAQSGAVAEEGGCGEGEGAYGLQHGEPRRAEAGDHVDGDDRERHDDREDAHAPQSDEGLRAALAARRELPGLPVLVLSQHVEQLYARELLADGAGGIGYFLKESVFNADQFIDALERVAGGGTAMDPAVITTLLSTGPSNRRLERLTEREHSVLGLMAEGLSNQAIGQRLFLSDSAISKYTTSMFGKLGITDDDNNNRRVLAVLAYLNKP
ncbi:LuxR C-terminal-related transcriptional regulator [Streptomyces sp. NPDC002446]